MSCPTPQLLSYYSNRINIYNNSCFIKLPNYKTCPPPSCTYIIPPNPPLYTPPYHPCSSYNSGNSYNPCNSCK